MKWMMIFVFFAAGCLEVVSILFRPVSLTFRLYGNIFAGENMLDAMATLVPGLGLVTPNPLLFSRTTDGPCSSGRLYVVNCSVYVYNPPA